MALSLFLLLSYKKPPEVVLSLENVLVYHNQKSTPFREASLGENGYMYMHG